MRKLKRWLRFKLPLRRALLGIFLSTLFVVGSVVLAWFAFATIEKVRKTSATFAIRHIKQIGPEKEALRTNYLCELLNLAQDDPQNLYSFDLEKAKEELLKSPVIKSATLSILPSDTLCIEYEVYKPVAYLHESSNTAIDAKGMAFPVVPYLSEKRLPYVYLGIQENQAESLWGKTLVGHHLEQALELLQLFEQPRYQECFQVSFLDVSSITSPHYGQREVIVKLEDRTTFSHEGQVFTHSFPRFIRFPVKGLQVQLENYLQMRPYLAERQMTKMAGAQEKSSGKRPLVIDMRLSDLAFVQDDTRTSKY